MGRTAAGRRARTKGLGNVKWLRYAVIAALVLLLLPVALPLAAFAVAQVGGCELNEGSASACMVAGVDVGELLYSALVLGWLALATLPMAFGLALVWGAIELVSWWRR